MHLRSSVNHGQLMIINSVSRLHLDGRCAITRTGQFRHARLPVSSQRQSCHLLLEVTAPARHRIRSNILLSPFAANFSVPRNSSPRYNAHSLRHCAAWRFSPTRF
jgi:hypothetical protein